MSIKFNSRAAVENSMPPIAEACASFQGFPPNKKYGDTIFEVLMGVIQRYRGTAAKRFYSMREVSVFFGVSLGTVQAVFRDLGREGVLTRVRSSQTMMVARTPRPRLAVRGVVCMPIWLPGFINFRDWRSLFSVLEDELARHRFVLEPVFFSQSEEITAGFVDRILKLNPDYVVWNAPAPADRMTMESIMDAGVPVLSILGARPPALPGRIYRTSHDRALIRGLKEWKAGGQIDQIVIPSMKGGDAAVKEAYGPALQVSPLPYQFKLYSDGALPEYLADLAPDRRTGIFFGDQLFFIRLCALAAEEIFRLFSRHRVIFGCQVTMQSWTMPGGIFVDWLAVPTRRLARRLAEDLSQSKGALPSGTELFEAEWRPQTPLEELARPYLTE